MAIEHEDIDDSKLHEPKGVKNALAGTIYRADGAGGGEWQHSSLSCHGQMEIVNNATVTAVTAAVDATLNTDTDYSKIVAGWGSPHVHNITFDTDKLTVLIAGHYELAFWSSFEVPTNNNFVGIKFSVNDSTPFSLQKIVTQSVTANDYKNVSGRSGLDLGAGDTLSVYMAATKTDNMVIEEAGLSLILLHEA